MAGVISLGVHAPSALPYLIAEGILPPEAPSTLYEWTIYSDNASGTDEEVLKTDKCVVWSRGGAIRRIFVPDNREQNVHHALLATFPGADEHPRQDLITGQAIRESSSHIIPTAETLSRRVSAWGGGTKQRHGTPSAAAAKQPSAKMTRALIIILDSQAHVHYLSGASFAINVPFEIERIYAAPQGILVQRKAEITTVLPLSPFALRPPSNSVLTSQPQSHSYQRSPLAKSATSGTSHEGHLKVSDVWHEIFRAPLKEQNEANPSIYSLKDTLGEFCPVANASLAPVPLRSRSDVSDVLVEYDNLDPAERMLYVSSTDELSSAPSDPERLVYLLVTMNPELDQINVWQGWYIRSRRLSSLIAARAAIKASRARRRSSFVTSASGLGSATPTVRPRDRVRESFAATAKANADGKSQQRPATKDDQKAQDEEEAMASQLDPDFDAARRPTKGSRRISSLLSRGDLVTGDAARATGSTNAGFASKRGPSLGASQDRRSLGASIYRRSRGSTQGSIFSRSLGQHDDSMDISSDSQQAIQAELDQLFQATQTSATIENALGGGGEELKQDFVVRKIHSFESGSPSNSCSAHLDWKVATLRRQGPSSSDEILSIAMLDSRTKMLRMMDCSIVSGPETNGAGVDTGSYRSLSTTIPAMMPVGEPTLQACCDLASIKYGDISAILCLLQAGSIRVLPSVGEPWTVPLPQQLRVFDPTSFQHASGRTQHHIRKTRNVATPSSGLRFQDSVPGHVDVSGLDGVKHRLRIKLKPDNSSVSALLNLCYIVLGERDGKAILSIWGSACAALHREHLASTNPTAAEWEALIVTVFTFAVGSIEMTSTKHASGSRRASSRSEGNVAQPASIYDNRPTKRSPAWQWLAPNEPSDLHGLNHTSERTSIGARRMSNRLWGHMSEFEAIARHLLHEIGHGPLEWLRDAGASERRYSCLVRLTLAIHLYREEQKLDWTADRSRRHGLQYLAAALAQMGHWLQWHAWDWRPGNYYAVELSTTPWTYSESVITLGSEHRKMKAVVPPSAFEWLEGAMSDGHDAQSFALPTAARRILSPTNSGMHLPRLTALQRLIALLPKLRVNPQLMEDILDQSGLSASMLDKLPASVTTPLREAIASCQRDPPAKWKDELIRTAGREDLTQATNRKSAKSSLTPHPSLNTNLHDVATALALAERTPMLLRTHEADRHAITILIFPEDRRFLDAAKITNPSLVQVAECPPRPEWSDIEHLEQQKKLMQGVMTRTIALSPGNALVHYESQSPLLSEKFHVSGFSMLCQMKPMDNTVSADRSGFTEEKLGWAFFHAGVSAGLQISRHATGIDTSWIVFNKPTELTNRHAGFLLALGLNGHLRAIAKWLAFKYLTPKHSMTSVGLLLGLSASHLGTMDSLITRMLSVHITRMLPPGAAELNVSSLTQSAGLIGIGLVYFDTQHRRMSEIMLSEIEHRDIDDLGSSGDALRDESYRLAAGFALGFINLGKGAGLQGLHGMGLLERLLSIAIGARPVDVVHVVDKAVAGAVLAIALIYMKTGDRSVARKIDVPDTDAQLDHTRPDILLLRTLAKHLILWDEIDDQAGWIRRNLPTHCVRRYYGKSDDPSMKMTYLPQLKSEDIPFFNVVSGLAWSLSLKFAGSGSLQVRDEVLSYLKLFHDVQKQEAYYYDAMLARNTVKRCIDLLALAAATVMAGTGDLETFRYLRRLHGRVDSTTTYGSHLAAHMAVGVLFLGGGTYTFGTSNMAVASLVCAFYPLFPSDVHDNDVHLQALRHFWVFAAEPRCLVVQDIDTSRPISMECKITMRDGSERLMKAPCLLPELSSIAVIQTADPHYWQVTLDFVSNPQHLALFLAKHTLRVRRAPALEASPLLFNSTLTALNEMQSTPTWRQMWDWMGKFPSIRSVDAMDLSLVIPPQAQSSMHLDDKCTVIDDRLALLRATRSNDRDELWNLRILFRWAEEASRSGQGRLRWLGKETIDALRAEVGRRMAEKVH